jgi:hypothetical protein
MSSEKKYLNAADIFGADDREIKEVEIPEWGGFVRFRVLSAAEALTFQESLNTPSMKADAWIRMFMLCAVDTDNKPLFTKEDLLRLKQKSAGIFLRLQKALLKFNGFTADAEDLLDAKND